MLRTNLCQTWHDDRNYWILQFDTSQCLTIHCGKLDIDANFNELDLHERSQCCEKDFMIILSQSPQSVICIWNAVETCVFVEAQSFDDMTLFKEDNCTWYFVDKKENKHRNHWQSELLASTQELLIFPRINQHFTMVKAYHWTQQLDTIFSSFDLQWRSL